MHCSHRFKIFYGVSQQCLRADVFQPVFVALSLLAQKVPEFDIAFVLCVFPAVFPSNMEFYQVIKNQSFSFSRWFDVKKQLSAT
jgi:hypothetical protein